MIVSDVVTVSNFFFFPPLWDSSRPLVCSVSVYMLGILGQTEILLLPLGSGLQGEESVPARRSLLSAGGQLLLLGTHRHNVSFGV